LVCHSGCRPHLVAHGLLYVGANDDHLYALDIADGSERWRFPVGTGAEYTLAPSPAYAGGAVYFASASSESGEGLYAVDAFTGEEVWHFEPDQPGLFTPAVADGVAYVGGDGGDVCAVDTGSGERRWKTTVSSAWSAPAVTGDSVFVQTMDGVLACLNRENGELRWEVETAASWSSPVIVGELAYIGSGGLWFEMGLYAVDRATGDQRWHMRVDGVTAPVAVSGNVVVVGTDEGAVCAISGSTADAVSRGTNGEGTFLTRIVFATEVDESNMPVDPADAFPVQTSQLKASFSFVGMQYEAAREVIWMLDDEPILARNESWVQGSSGRLAENIIANEGNLPAGRYELELRVNGTPTRRGTAVVG
jgi:outer membrane protein assembly factor BamB